MLPKAIHAAEVLCDEYSGVFAAELQADIESRASHIQNIRKNQSPHFLQSATIFWIFSGFKAIIKNGYERVEVSIRTEGPQRAGVLQLASRWTSRWPLFLPRHRIILR